MNKAIILALACISIAPAFAGAVPTEPVPDAGATALLLGIGALVLSLVRKASR